MHNKFIFPASPVQDLAPPNFPQSPMPLFKSEQQAIDQELGEEDDEEDLCTDSSWDPEDEDDYISEREKDKQKRLDKAHKATMAAHQKDAEEEWLSSSDYGEEYGAPKVKIVQEEPSIDIDGFDSDVGKSENEEETMAQQYKVALRKAEMVNTQKIKKLKETVRRGSVLNRILNVPQPHGRKGKEAAAAMSKTDYKEMQEREMLSKMSKESLK